MINVLVRHKIADYDRWKMTFDAAIGFRQAGGERSCRIFRNPEDSRDLTLLFEWESLEKARSFMSSEELRTRMQQAGVLGPPQIEFMNELYVIRRSAAD